MADSRIVLPGLDGANPLAFLAALGVLRALDYRARLHDRVAPRLAWTDDGYWQPVIHGYPSVDAIIGELLEDKATWQDDPAFLLAYDETGETLLDPRTVSGKLSRDLKPRPAALRKFLDDLGARAVSRKNFAEHVELRRSLDTAAVYGSELVQDNNGNTKPTGFHFTAGNQQFLKALSQLQTGVTSSDLLEALAGPWLRESTLPNMSWDATYARLYALRAKKPSDDKKTSVAGADWLAFIGLGAMPSFPQGNRLETTGIKGGWKDSSFTWAVWECPVNWRVATSICRTINVKRMTTVERRSRRISAVFSSRISRFDQGGYGSFSPAEVK
jgi:hypothetical protein